MMGKGTRVLELFLMTSLTAVAGCGGDPDVPAQRDIYTRMEDCVADWGDKELCQAMDATAQAEAAKQQPASTGVGSGYVPYYMWGPTYYGPNRVHYNSQGTAITPRSNKAVRQAVTQVRTSTVPSSARRGGFGSTGKGIGSSGS
jgi:uncharacterized protein YgiB involved in biofilm formation